MIEAAPVSKPAEVSLRKICWTFLIVGSPTAGLVSMLVLGLFNTDPLFKTVAGTTKMVLAPIGLLACYGVGLIPSLIIGTAYHRARTIGRRVALAAAIGASVYAAFCCFIIFILGGPKAPVDVWTFILSFGFGGLVSASLCACIIEAAFAPTAKDDGTR